MSNNRKNIIKEELLEKIIMNEMLTFNELEELFNYTIKEFERTIGDMSNDKKIKRLGEVIKNNHTDYYHFVPKCKKFDNKLINFRKVSNVTYDELLNNFEHLAIVSGNYSKDILCRFSTYYSRQGQPDLHFENIAKKILTEMQQRTSSSV